MLGNRFGVDAEHCVQTVRSADAQFFDGVVGAGAIAGDSFAGELFQFFRLRGSGKNCGWIKHGKANRACHTERKNFSFHAANMNPLRGEVVRPR